MIRKSNIRSLALMAIAIVQLLPTTASAYSDITQYNQLVNMHNSIQPLTYVPPDLVEPGVTALYTPKHSESELRRDAATQLALLFYAANYSSIHLVLTSGFRSYSQQAQLYMDSTRTIINLKEVARAGFSEHQTGLAVDIVTDDHVCAAQVCFALTRAADWLQKNAPTYGFILRYPQYKTAQTGYPYEPWHYRYVGVTLAKILTKSGVTLDEYTN